MPYLLVPAPINGDESLGVKLPAAKSVNQLVELASSENTLPTFGERATRQQLVSREPRLGAARPTTSRPSKLNFGASST
jgi:hypothetical protein